MDGGGDHATVAGHVVPLGRGRGASCGPTRGTPTPWSPTLDAAPDARWVQLPFAGIENFVHLVDHDREWTCGKGVYAEPVAELALALALAGMRGRAPTPGRRSWSRAARAQPARRPGDDPRRRRDHRLARPPPPAVGLPHHRRAAHGRPPRRRRRRARGRPLCRRPARRRSRRPGPRPHAGDRGHHRRRRAVADGAPRLARQRGPRAATSSPTTSSTPCATASSAAPAST